MCQSQDEGGRRCAAHTRPAYQRALHRFGAEPDGHRRAGLVEDHKDTLIAHAMTPSGRTELADTITRIEQVYTDRPASTPEEEAGRGAYLSALRLTATQADIRNDVETTVRRRQRFEQTGSHAEPPTPECSTVPTVPVPAERTRASPVHLVVNNYTRVTRDGPIPVRTVRDKNLGGSPTTCAVPGHHPAGYGNDADCACDATCRRCHATPGQPCMTTDTSSARGGFIGGGWPTKSHRQRIADSPRIQGLRDGTRTRCDVGDHTWALTEGETSAQCSACGRTEPVHAR